MTTVTSTELRKGPRHHVVHLTGIENDSTGESAVQKVDISALTDSQGNTATYSAVDYIEYQVNGYNYVVLAWDHSTDDTIAVLRGEGVINWYDVGGKVDPQSAGGTGDIVLTSDGAADGDSYDITLYLRPKA